MGRIPLAFPTKRETWIIESDEDKGFASAFTHTFLGKDTDRVFSGTSLNEDIEYTDEDIKERILNSTSILLFLSDDTPLSDDKFRLQIDYSLELSKLIVVIARGDFNKYSEIPKSISSLSWLFYPTDVWEEHLLKLGKSTDAKLNKDLLYQQRHTATLRRALEWKQENFKENLLLNSKDKIMAREFVDNAAAGCVPALCKEQINFLAASIDKTVNVKQGIGSSEKASVFMAFIQEEREYVESMRTPLADAGHLVTGTFDVDAGEATIFEEIAKADVFVPILSNSAIEDTVYNSWSDYAFKLGKLVIPIAATQGIDFKKVPKNVGDLNWLFHTSSNNELALLIKDLEKDVGLVKLHNIMLGLAMEWEKRGKKKKMLLSLSDLTKLAEPWIYLLAMGKKPSAGELQLAYIAASRKRGFWERILRKAAKIASEVFDVIEEVSDV